MNYIQTGNQVVSLPCIRESDASVEGFNFLHMAGKGLINVCGTASKPFLQPFCQVNGQESALEGLAWSLGSYWIPQFACRAGEAEIDGVILAPVGERGFAVRLSVTNKGESAMEAEAALALCWGGTRISINESKPVNGTKHCYESGWNGSYVFDMRCGLPLFAFAPMTAEKSAAVLTDEDGGEETAVCCRISRGGTLEPGEALTLTLFLGLGYEEVAAATSAKEMLRKGWERLSEKTLEWLLARVHSIPDARLDKIYNQNLFYCMFFSTGVTLDTEELVLVTSRSPRYYVSAAYWDRDSLLWAFPAILDADAGLARDMLLYVFGRQRRNIGVHSRYIDGTVLEPGFELDELISPVLALERYIDKTGDRQLLEKAEFIEGIGSILRRLAEHKHEDISLFSTFLQPTDDEIVYPYLTYNNVLVWKGLLALEKLYPGGFSLPVSPAAVRDAIWEHCVKEIDGEMRFAWSLDLAGSYDVYDEPPGSLLLLPYYGFCGLDDPIYAATSRLIRSENYRFSFAGKPIAEIGCLHAPHPWILSIANSMLCGHGQSALKHLALAKMDNGIACESVDEYTGECSTGAAFATCAGFLCHALRTIFERGDWFAQ
jgi:hypothetical protein